MLPNHSFNQTLRQVTVGRSTVGSTFLPTWPRHPASEGPCKLTVRPQGMSVGDPSVEATRCKKLQLTPHLKR